MKVNFEIEDTIALRFQKRYFDLHNNFDFKKLEYNVANQEVILYWRKGEGDWIQPTEPNELILLHKNVSFFKVLERDVELPFTEDDCLAEMTFYESSDRINNEYVTQQNLPNVDDDIIYSFQSQLIIRIHCEEIELIIKN